MKSERTPRAIHGDGSHQLDRFQAKPTRTEFDKHNEDDEYGSDFEAYSDDFEDDDTDQEREQKDVPGINENRHDPDRRTRWVLERVHLIEERFDLLTMEPGLAPRRPALHKVTQYNDDWVAEASQTITNVAREAACQYPDQSSGGSALVRLDSVRMQKFVRAATQLCDVFLMHRRTVATTLSRHHDNGVELAAPGIIMGRDVISIEVCSEHPHMVLVGYGLSDTDRRTSLLCLWDLEQPATPFRILSCFGAISSAILAPYAGTIVVVAGLQHGSLALWDPREPDSMHQRKTDPYLRRRATFTTDDFIEGNHSAAIVAVKCLSNGTRNVQIGSLDATGAVNIWTMMDAAPGAAADSDPGLIVGGRVKLILSVLVRMSAAMGIATAIEFCGPDANDYLIAQGAQAVQRGKRFGQAPQPSAYYKQGREPDLPTAIASSPFIAHLFVVGYATGSVCLFSLACSQPVLSWPSMASTAITRCVWSMSNPSQFFVLDASGHLQICDVLARDRQGALQEVQLPAESSVFNVVPIRGRSHLQPITFRSEKGVVKVSNIKLDRVLISDLSADQMRDMVMNMAD